MFPINWIKWVNNFNLGLIGFNACMVLIAAINFQIINWAAILVILLCLWYDNRLTLARQYENFAHDYVLFYTFLHSKNLLCKYEDYYGVDNERSQE